MTLEPGDIILTGTPAGSRLVEPGDVVEVELVGLSSVRNPVVEADPRSSRRNARSGPSSTCRPESRYGASIRGTEREAEFEAWRAARANQIANVSRPQS